MPTTTHVPVVNKDTRTNVLLRSPYHCILFNDEEHGMDEVVIQIVKAINCSVQRAAEIMLEAHNSGRAIVITAHLERCEHAAAVLEEIRLGTKIEPA